MSWHFRDVSPEDVDLNDDTRSDQERYDAFFGLGAWDEDAPTAPAAHITRLCRQVTALEAQRDNLRAALKQCATVISGEALSKSDLLAALGSCREALAATMPEAALRVENAPK